MKKTFQFTFFLVFNCIVAQQKAHTNVWSRIAFAKQFNTKLKAETEFQKRWQNNITENSNNPFDYKLVNSFRLWTYYQLNDKITFIISPFAYYENNQIIKKESDKNMINNYENRYSIATELCQKLNTNLKLQCKTGLEYRDFKKSTNDYFRFREKLSFKYSFNDEIALLGYDELLINITSSNNLHNFDQNRLGLSLNYNIIKELKLELGYMKIERSQKANLDNLYENNIVFNCYYTLSNKK